MAAILVIAVVGGCEEQASPSTEVTPAVAGAPAAASTPGIVAASSVQPSTSEIQREAIKQEITAALAASENHPGADQTLRTQSFEKALDLLRAYLEMEGSYVDNLDWMDQGIHIDSTVGKNGRLFQWSSPVDISGTIGARTIYYQYYDEGELKCDPLLRSSPYLSGLHYVTDHTLFLLGGIYKTEASYIAIFEKQAGRWKPVSLGALPDGDKEMRVYKGVIHNTAVGHSMSMSLEDNKFHIRDSRLHWVYNENNQTFERAAGDPDEKAGIRMDGVQPLEHQSFTVTLDPWGKVKFISGKRETPKAEAVFFLADESGGLKYEFPSFTGNTGWWLYDIRAVAFRDVNQDGWKDVIVIADYMTGVGPTGAQPFPIAGIYYQLGNRFVTNPDLDVKLNRTRENETIEKVLGFLAREGKTP
ncbi:hypothetical protein [Paenibacillus koleovorans]|uniref:hypothetical protein n=1 Tax=Paenibacillus koleovorans TaxID=121608 RepID=UPI000FD86730|nr:hypothetical protein [Paenibacillus koleovorans]